MIKSFRHKGLSELWSKRWTNQIDDRLHKPVIELLDVLDAAAAPGEINMPGLKFQRLDGSDPPRHAVHVDGPWFITFAFADADARRVDFEQHR